MSSSARILVVGRHASIMSRVRDLLAAEGITTITATTDAEALAAIEAGPVDALLLGGGVEPQSRRALADAFASAQPGRPIIEHYGGPHGLVEHVRQALGW
jgi:DNA-binding NtrC family response regulator